MTFFGRLRLFGGILLVIAICGALFLYLQNSMSRVTSREAYIDADSYTVGLDYSGVVEVQYKQQGDIVKAGDALFEIRSASLSDAIRSNQVTAANLLYSINSKGRVVITASADGRVREISHGQGTFVPANEKLATIDLANSAYVRATYKLSAPDYARLGTNSRILVSLPDGVKVPGKVYDVSFATVDREVLTTVRARIDTSKVNHWLLSSGTPVQTVLYLDDNSLYTQLSRAVTTAIRSK